ncbi:MAG: hypothetical protein IPH45_04450 [Bacteroidales bacterium]|nr:hypothetical protein [Bacteroidales bacterium]
MKTTSFLLFFLVAVSYFPSNAQETDPKLVKAFDKAMTIEKFLALPDDDFWKYSKPMMYQNQGFDDGHGMFTWPPSMKVFPKRVGLLSFIVFDPGFFDAKVKKYGGPDISYTVTTTKSASISIDNTKAMAGFFYEEALPELKENFRYFGSELLTPEEFITSDAIRQAYNSFNYEEKASAKVFSGESAANTIAVPEGQDFFYAENFTVPGFVKAIGPKAEELGLDAVLIIKIEMGIDDKGTISVQSMNYAMYGKNPTPKDPDKRYVAVNPATGYNDYVVYSAKKLGGEKEAAMNVVLSMENKTSKVYRFEGIGKLVNKLALGANYELNMWINGDWKPFKYK